MDISCEEAHCSSDTLVESAAVCQVPTETHSCGPDVSIAGGQRKEIVHRKGRIFIVGSDFLKRCQLICTIQV